MQALSFAVSKFRNIVDSGLIAVDPAVTCLVGKNEAGKSGMLEALYLFNPAYKDDKFDVQEHYPRWLTVQDRRAQDLNEVTPISVTFLLDGEDLAAVAKHYGAKALTHPEITVKRKYGGGRLWTLSWSEDAVIRHLITLMPSAIQELGAKVEKLDELRQLIESADTDVVTAEDRASALTVLTEAGLEKTSVWLGIVNVLTPRLPKFFRFTGYSTLPGRIDFRQLANASTDGPGSSALQTARALLRLAGTDIEQLGEDDYELRKSELEAVQIDLSNQVFEYWRQNPNLEVLIDVDKENIQQQNGHRAVARFLDIRLRDKRTGYSNNFSQRSSGFQWFFSFLAAFSEFESTRESPIVLLDEPALTLHGKAQADFLRFINKRLASASPVIYTTHSPFMVEADRLDRVRIIEDHGPPLGATNTTDVLAADSDSLFPLQAALGYDIAQNLFVGPHNLVVEGTSDLIYLRAMSRACGAAGKATLDSRWRILPAGGATNIPTFVSLIGPHLDITVLADSDTKGMQRVTNMIERKLLADHRFILVSRASTTDQADIEDLFSEGDYIKLYNKTFGATIKLADLPKGPRIVKRVEASQGAFDHGRVAETLLLQHEQSFSETTLERFSELLTIINSTLDDTTTS
ncbi:AAA family ATPase [Lysobacter capsici]|uniref:AAA family ATPase n=1 Tax=Lysobacter capsici TaxID=435897 RepID=UPI00287B9929|nr:AAA family ATPase [Lysobacter capsici]WND80485.1 AAA family ATPase [Lysobacter capsici]WND85682.1 AAA family ATPase [Lysobacter capsici]